ncbi:hypothetical protein GBAR_LOCUS28397 [Geodia barretti]|uniref:Uncharacterized protein n=1 Tax=Geodia barretti TaxID=519541 RepID=A0AA35TP95_GEOBA|nr:hypothetical protein GBAR_LOCUS28397 [Geodia barretti]
MANSAQYSALTRLLSHNTRVHELEDLLLRLPITEEMAFMDEDSLVIEDEEFSNPIADLQDDIDKEVRASLVACWFAMPTDVDELDGLDHV